MKLSKLYEEAMSEVYMDFDYDEDGIELDYDDDGADEWAGRPGHWLGMPITSIQPAASPTTESEDPWIFLSRSTITIPWLSITGTSDSMSRNSNWTTTRDIF